MKTVVERLHTLVESVPDRIDTYSEEEFSSSKGNKWSKKEILGHLCDSATNNHHRFVVAQFEQEPYKVTCYSQNDWVRVQGYRLAATREVLELWVCLNKHILRVLKGIPEEKCLTKIEVGAGEPKTLLWLAEDYIVHLEHHLKQIFGD